MTDTVSMMKQRILSMAIRGNLVTQDNNEEVASELIKKIHVEKDQMIKKKIIKKHKKFSDIPKEIEPYAIPDSWKWVRLGDISNYGSHQSVQPSEIDPKSWLLDLEDLKSNSNEIIQYKSMQEKPSKSNKYIVRKGNVLYGKLRPYLNKVSIAEKNGYCSTEILPLHFYGDVNEKFMMYVLSSNYFVNFATNNSQGTKMPRLGSVAGKNACIPIPPYAEQKRIVKKIEELFVIIERVIERKEKTLQTINKIRETTLNEAIRGKLVEHNKEDEPASELILQMNTEKNQLIKEKKIKKQSKIPVILDDVLPFDIPQTWKWTRLGNVAINVHYGYTASSNDTGSAKMLRITDIQKGCVDWKTVPFCEIEDEKIQQYQLEYGDILIARTGGTIGKSFVVKEAPLKSVFASYLIRVIPVKAVNPLYLHYFLNSGFYWEQLRGMSAGTGQPNVNATNLKKLVLPLPPIKEQKRIVEKIDRIMKICDKIERSTMGL